MGSASAQRGGGVSPRQAFEELSAGSAQLQAVQEMRQRMDLEAASILAREPGLAPSLPTRRAQVESVSAALMRWQMNQSRFPNGSWGAAAALYRVFARMNHSCRPTVGVRLQLGALRPGELEPADGRLVVVALRDLRPGEESSATTTGPTSCWPGPWSAAGTSCCGGSALRACAPAASERRMAAAPPAAAPRRRRAPAAVRGSWTDKGTWAGLVSIPLI
ncbi:unnamed protein product, partial [Prorocentrum cordatum]